MTRDYFGVPRATEKRLEQADVARQRAVARQAVVAVRAHLPPDEPDVDTALAAVEAGAVLADPQYRALRAVATGYAERVDRLRAENGRAAELAELQHRLIAVNVLECAADPDMTGDRALRSLSTAFMVLSRDKAGTDELLGYLKRLG